jgi:formate/nitrite transporter FocA (FNT family)
MYLSPAAKVTLTLFSSLLAGICIGLGCVINLKVGGIAGACLFSFGLLTILCFNLKLYTGVVGYFNFKKPVIQTLYIFLVLIGNLCGTALLADTISVASPELALKANSIMLTRITYSYVQTFFLAVWCGFIMTACVWSYRQNQKAIIVLLGIPIFILSGFIHCIADSFYMFLSHTYAGEGKYAIAVLGNFVGCNLMRIIEPFQKIHN